jgi:hypothetical protein
LWSQVDVGALGFRVQGQVFGVEFHTSTFTTGRLPRQQILTRISHED